jgi:membrane dipeptidase
VPDTPEEDEFVERYRVDHPAPRATIDDVVAHVEHVREVAGVDHVGLGGDYDGVGELPEGLEDVTGYPRLLATLADRGWSDKDLARLTCRNVLRTMGDAGLTSTPV